MGTFCFNNEMSENSVLLLNTAHKSDFAWHGLIIVTQSTADMPALSQTERTKGAPAAVDLFLEKLLASNEPGWFQSFIDALQHAGN